MNIGDVNVYSLQRDVHNMETNDVVKFCNLHGLITRINIRIHMLSRTWIAFIKHDNKKHLKQKTCLYFRYIIWSQVWTPLLSLLYQELGVYAVVYRTGKPGQFIWRL